MITSITNLSKSARELEPRREPERLLLHPPGNAMGLPRLFPPEQAFPR